MKDIINNLKNSDTLKIQLTIAINFISSKDIDEECKAHSNNDNIDIMIYDKADEVTEEIFELLLNRYQIGLETSMKASDFIFDYVNQLKYKCHKINLERDRSYLDSPNLMKNKKATINPINDDDKYFQYAATVALNHKEIRKSSQRTSKINPFINKHNWKGINYLLGKDDWNKLEKNNPTIPHNVLYIKKMNLYPDYISKHNSNHEKQIFLLMIPNGEG